MSRSLCRRPVSLIHGQEWNRVGADRQWLHILAMGRAHTTAAGQVKQSTRHETNTPWTVHRQPVVDDSLPRPRLSQLRAETNSPPLSSYLTDTFSRTHDYLRISVTERCNLRCVYCMPEEGVPLSPSAHLLTTPEIVYLSQLFVGQGVNKIRITGGEPTIRKDIVRLMKQLGNLRASGLRELCLTTNGLALYRKLDSMVEAGLTGVNLSLDTLDPYQFTLMTRRNGHEAVLRSIDRILEMKKAGAPIKLKINCVVMRGINEREIIPFVELGREKDIETRFIEYMPFDGNKWSENKMLSFQEMLTMIRDTYPGLEKVHDQQNDTSKTYRIPGFVGRMGFITSMTQNFCGTCNRLRITSDGNLKVCLFGNSEVSLRDILRESNDGQPLDQAAADAVIQAETAARETTSAHTGTHTPSQHGRLLDLIGAAVKRKKAKHAGIGKLENMKNRPMILIGGLRKVPSQHVFRRIPQEGHPDWLLPTQLSREDESTPSSSVKKRAILFGRPPSPKRQRAPRSLERARSESRTTEAFSNGTVPGTGPSSTKGPQLKPTFQPSSGVSLAGLPPWAVPSNVEGTAEHHPVPSTLAETSRLRRFPTYNNAAFEQNSALYLAHSGSAQTDDSVINGQRRRRTKDDSEIGRPPRHTTSAATKNGLAGTGTEMRLSHLTPSGHAHMVDISNKSATGRAAKAQAFVLFSREGPYETLSSQSLPKGDALAVARIAGIQASKKTADLIPLAHPGLGITGAEVEIDLLRPATENSAGDACREGFKFGGVKITALISCHGKTGVEMEALTAASTAALAMYDMCKAVDQHMLITGVQVIMKKGGKHKDWQREVDVPDDPFQPQISNDTETIGDSSTPISPSPSPIGSCYSPSHQSSASSAPIIAVPEATPDFFESASQERDLFIANTTYPDKAAEIASLRRQHRALNWRITALQRLAGQDPKPPRIDSFHLADSITYLLEKKENETGRESDNNQIDADAGNGPQQQQQRQYSHSQTEPQPQHHHQQHARSHHHQSKDLRHDYDKLQSLMFQRRQIARKVLDLRAISGSQISEADMEDDPSVDEDDVYNLHHHGNSHSHGRAARTEDDMETREMPYSGDSRGRAALEPRPELGPGSQHQLADDGDGSDGDERMKDNKEEEEEEHKQEIEDEVPPVRTLRRREAKWTWRWQGGVYGLYNN